LSLEEGFLVSRVDGRTPVDQIAVLMGKSVDETQRLVERLTKAGVLMTGAEAPASTAPAEDPYEGFDFDARDLSEPVDLSEDERKKILYTHAHLDEWTYYKLLGVRWRDDAKAVKRAYFERSKEWHPDRFRRPQLGSYKERLDDIFRAVRDAYAVLSDPKRKAEYDRIHAPSFDEEDMAEMLAEERREERNARRDEERKRRRLERNPLRKRMVRAKELHQEALALEEKGELLEALRLAQAACAFHERAEYKELRRRLQTATAELRVAPLMRRGLHAESMTSWEDAVAIFTEAVRLAPDHGPARLRLAYNMLMAKRPPSQVSEHVQRAVQVLPEEPEAHFVRGLCYERGEMDKLAIRAYQRAIELKPNYADAKKRLKKLRWGF
jgi:curved DNA-binding protein CbpA